MKGKLSVRNGVWYCVIYFEDENGKFNQKWVSTGLKERGNKRNAEKFLEAKIQELSYLEPDKVIAKRPVKTPEPRTSWLGWLIRYVNEKKDSLSPTQKYVVEKSYVKAFREFWEDKDLPLSEVKADDILSFYEYLRSTRHVKNITLKHYASILRPALRKAFLEKRIKDNPYDYLPPLKRDKIPHSFYDSSDMEKFFSAIRGHKLELAFKFLAYYGLRRSELLGLRWESIDFANKTVSIDHKLLLVERKVIVSDKMKTESSCRTLPLIPAIERGLVKHKKQISKNEEYFGIDYNKKYADYIFVNELGELFRPDYLTHSFEKIIRRHNLKKIRLHDLRHSCASIMLANGVQMKQIQEWLGHSNFSTTADVYSHLDFSSKLQSANVISSALSKKRVPKKQDDSSELSEIKEKLYEHGFSSVDELLELLSSKR